MKRIARLAFYSLAAMIITACGGGGDGFFFVPTTTGPTVVSTIPAKDATGVATATKVSATFSVPIAPIAFTFPNYTSAFTLKDPGGAIVQGTMASSVDAKTWTFTPDASLAVGTKYTATFKKGPGGIKDLAVPPNNMTADYVWSFTTSAWNGNQMLGTTVDDKAYGVASDSSGNIYVTGYTNGGLDGVLNADNTPTGGTTADVFLTKYNAAGVKQWTTLLGAPGSFQDVANGIAIDSSNNIYIAGFTNGVLAGAPGGTTNQGGADIFVAKFNAADVAGATAPSTAWVRQWGTAFNDAANGVAVDATGNVYVAGYTGDNPADLTSGDVFLAQLSPAGVTNWTKTLASTTAAKERAYGVAVNGANVYVAGFTNGVLAGAPAGTTNQGAADIFVAQFDNVAANTTPTWVQQLGTAANDYGNAVVVDATGVYVAASAGGALDGHAFAGGLTDAFLVKYAAAGTKVWSSQLGTTGNDDAFGVTLDASGNVYITGDTEGVLPGAPLGTVNQGLADLFFAKYSTAGAVILVRQQGSIQSDVGNAIAFSSVGVGGTPSLFVAGATFGTLPGVNVHFNNADPSGNTADIFLTKYDTSGVLFQ